MPAGKTVFTREPDGSFTVRNNKTYEEMLTDYEKVKLLQQARMLSASISSTQNQNQHNKKLNPTWQFELHDLILGK